MPDEKDDNRAPLDKVRGNRSLARGSGFIAKRVRDLARDVKDRELVGRGENNGFECEWGSEGSGPGEFKKPTAIAVDKDGNVLVADHGNRRIQKFDSNGRFLDTLEIDVESQHKYSGNPNHSIDLRIFVDEKGSITLTDVEIYSGMYGWEQLFVSQLDTDGGIESRKPSQVGLSQRGGWRHWDRTYAFVHPTGDIYVWEQGWTYGWERIVRFSTASERTGCWGAREGATAPEVPYPMTTPLFSGANGEIYGLLQLPLDEIWDRNGKMGFNLTTAIHLPNSKCKEGYNDPYYDVDSEGSISPLVGRKLEDLEDSFNETDMNLTVCRHSFWDADDTLREELTIGRSRENTIVVDGSTVSRHHARIEFSDGAYYIEDLGSRNGTTVNGSRVTRMRLGSQSSIKVGKETIKFFCPAWVPRLRQMLSEIEPDVRGDNPLVLLKFSSECEPIGVWPHKLRDPHLVTGSFAVNADSNVFFSCGECNEVTELSPEGDLITRWGEEGTGPGQFDGPMGIAAGPANEIYVADTGNHRIQKFRASVKA